MKLPKSDLTRLQTLVDTLTAARLDVEDALARYNLALAEADVFRSEIADQFQNEYDDKSEKWQESDAGSAASDLIDEWSNVDFEMVEFQLDHPERLLDLPTETE